MKTLEDTYNRFANTYESTRQSFDTEFIFNDFYDRLGNTTGTLLDLGCGAGKPIAKFFVEKGWSVTGVDFSEKMLALARDHVPEIQTIHSDIQTLAFDPNSFDAIIASYSLFHIPSENHQAVFSNMYAWLRPRGQALFTYATKHYTGYDEFDGYKEFLGEQLFYSHQTPEHLETLLKRIGFDIQSMQYHTIAAETFLWVIVKK